jgi:hypothetical protein
MHSTRVFIKAAPTSQVEKKDHVDMHDAAADLYCLCQKPYNPSLVYIGCDLCDGWFHAKCVGITAKQAASVDEFVCPTCQGASGQKTTWKDPHAIREERTASKRLEQVHRCLQRMICKVMPPILVPEKFTL